jgi:hypothetical protein
MRGFFQRLWLYYRIWRLERELRATERALRREKARLYDIWDNESIAIVLRLKEGGQ